jgi:hypothetical protein
MTDDTVPAAGLAPIDVRQRIVEALELDLVGPRPGHPLESERLPIWTRPSNWYTTGFLIPSATPPDRASDLDSDEDVEVVPEGAGLSEESGGEGRAAKKSFFPSSMGISFLADQAAASVRVTVHWGDYDRVKATQETPAEEDASSWWQRLPRTETLDIPLSGGDGERHRDIPRSGGLTLVVLIRTFSASGPDSRLSAGTKSVSVFLVNYRPPRPELDDLAYAFQPVLEVTGDRPFPARPDLRGARARDWDDRLADLHYADSPEFAVGHGIAAEWDLIDGKCHVLRTAWMPQAQVERTVTVDVPGAMQGMYALGGLADGAAAGAALGPIVDRYRIWIGEQRDSIVDPTSLHGRVSAQLLRNAERAAARMSRGIDLLATDRDLLDAFRVANRAVGRALTKRLGEAEPKWRTFQLAFLLVNLSGVADPLDDERETVDLLFFPTGGGKTEAYLGLAAIAMVLRRLRNPANDGRTGAGVSVVMRYTLRLLTLDQLSRAAGLVCALELERAADETRYGVWPFEIGLWVGKGATANVMGYKGFQGSGDARSRVRQYKDNPRFKPIPLPIERCPWCDAPFAPASFVLLPNDDFPNDLRITCANPACDFTRDRPLPIVAVDDPLYRRLPAFVIATVDKFAALPWMGQSGALLGGADRYDANGFYGAAEPGVGHRLDAPLLPPDLIIQDELHLISGPLGTMTGLYETAVAALCARTVEGKVVRPKIVASTATVRRAEDQIQALFARPVTDIFPPPGPSRRDSFFARVQKASESPARLYVGVAAQGRNPREVMRKVWPSLMGAAQRAYLDAGGGAADPNPADPYMTVLGYFNSLRELGGARRIIEEQVQNTVRSYGLRKRFGEADGLFADRRSFTEVLELTSRVSTAEVARARQRLGTQYRDEGRVDCALATNMISVGLDIQRLGLMVVLGQPKTHAEYIQATSRVGRDAKRPGLVVTLLSTSKPRDRSHYERFRHYHETFYRSVEVTSVTPFSSGALDHGLAGAVVAYARHHVPALTPIAGAMWIDQVKPALRDDLNAVFADRVRAQPIDDAQELDERLRATQDRIGDLLDAWSGIVAEHRKVGAQLAYQKHERKASTTPKPLLHYPLDHDAETPLEEKFRVNRSMRDVEPEVNLYLRTFAGLSIDPNA